MNYLSSSCLWPLQYCKLPPSDTKSGLNVFLRSAVFLLCSVAQLLAPTLIPQNAPFPNVIMTLEFRKLPMFGLGWKRCHLWFALRGNGHIKEEKERVRQVFSGHKIIVLSNRERKMGGEEPNQIKREPKILATIPRLHLQVFSVAVFQ